MWNGITYPEPGASVWNDLWCVRKCCKYVVIVPASRDVC